MSKCDVSVMKKFTINTGNYSSIQPSVSISVKDVDIDKIQKVNDELETLVSGLLLVHIREDSDLMKDFKRMGVEEFFKEAGSNIDFQVKNSVKKIKDLTKGE